MPFPQSSFIECRGSISEFFEFFAAWFPDVDLEGLSHSEIVLQFLTTVSAAKRMKVLREIEDLLGQPGFRKNASQNTHGASLTIKTLVGNG